MERVGLRGTSWCYKTGNLHCVFLFLSATLQETQICSDKRQGTFAPSMSVVMVYKLACYTPHIPDACFRFVLYPYTDALLTIIVMVAVNQYMDVVELISVTHPHSNHKTRRRT